MLPSTQHTTTAIILLFLAGSSYSLGFFAIPVEGHANPPGSLNGVWNMSLALSNLFIIPVRMRLGVYLSAGLAASPKSLPLLASKTHRLRIIACIASCGMAMYILAAIAVSQNNRQLIALALVAINTGAALFYFLGLELLTAWNSQRVGLFVGLGQMAFSLGSAAFSAIFGALQNYLGTVQALHASAALIFPICALGTVLLEWPHSPPISAPGQTLDLQHHRDMFPKLGWHHLLYLPPFWLYIFVIFTAQAGYAFILYFFSMGHKFGQSSHVVLIAFQCIAVVSTLSRPAFGLITNTFKTTSGIFSMASTNMMLVMLFAQAGLYFLLIPISDASSFWAFCVTVGLLLVGFSGGACAISTLAHEQFGIENSSLILGVGGSISMGLGESFAIALVSAFLGDDISSGNASSYNVYYVMAGFWSIFGVFSCVGIIWLRVHGYTCATYLEEEKGEIKCWATDSSDLKGNSVDSFTGYGTMVQDDV